MNTQRKSVLGAAGYVLGANGKPVVDQKNAVGGLQLMLRGQAAEDTGMRNSFVNRGIQGSGLQGAAGMDLHIAHGAQSADFGRGLAGQLSGFEQQKQDAGNAYASSLWQAQQQQAESAIANNQFNNPVLPAEQTQQQMPFQTQVMQPAGAQAPINFLNNPQFQAFLKQLFQGGNTPFLGGNLPH